MKNEKERAEQFLARLDQLMAKEESLVAVDDNEIEDLLKLGSFLLKTDFSEGSFKLKEKIEKTIAELKLPALESGCESFHKGKRYGDTRKLNDSDLDYVAAAGSDNPENNQGETCPHCGAKKLLHTDTCPRCQN